MCQQDTFHSDPYTHCTCRTVSGTYQLHTEKVWWGHYSLNFTITTTWTIDHGSCTCNFYVPFSMFSTGTPWRSDHSGKHFPVPWVAHPWLTSQIILKRIVPNLYLSGHLLDHHSLIAWFITSYWNIDIEVLNVKCWLHVFQTGTAWAVSFWRLKTWGNSGALRAFSIFWEDVFCEHTHDVSIWQYQSLH